MLDSWDRAKHHWALTVTEEHWGHTFWFLSSKKTFRPCFFFVERNHNCSIQKKKIRILQKCDFLLRVSFEIRASCAFAGFFFRLVSEAARIVTLLVFSFQVGFTTCTNCEFERRMPHSGRLEREHKLKPQFWGSPSNSSLNCERCCICSIVGSIYGENFPKSETWQVWTENFVLSKGTLCEHVHNWRMTQLVNCGPPYNNLFFIWRSRSL
jgi:hypothetical protein